MSVKNNERFIFSWTEGALFRLFWNRISRIQLLSTLRSFDDMICIKCKFDKSIPRDPPLGARGMRDVVSMRYWYCYHCENYMYYEPSFRDVV